MRTTASRPLLILRHGATTWAREGRLQGRTDLPLSEEGRREIASWQLPHEFIAAEVFSSPLQRAAETARILSKKEPHLDSRLIEMSYGTWEGKTKEELPPGEVVGGWGSLDDRAPGGESLREVLVRLTSFFEGLRQGNGPAVLVTHKGVLLALVSLLSKWQGGTKPPYRVRDGRALIMNLGSTIELDVLVTANHSLVGIS